MKKPLLLFACVLLVWMSVVQVRSVAKDTEQESTLPGAVKKIVVVEKTMPELTFQGKTFEQWVSELQTELDPKLRAEAFRALATFGANGKGKEATEAIVAELRNYDYSVYDDSPSGKMKEAAIEAFVTQPPFDPCIPLNDSLPVLMRCLKEGNPAQQSLAGMVCMRLLPANILRLQEGIDIGLLYDVLGSLKDDDRSPIAVGPRRALIQTLGTVDPSGEYVLRFLKETVEKSDAKGFSEVFAAHFNNENVKKQGFGAPNSGIRPFVFTDESDFYGGMGGNVNRDAERKWTPFGENLLKFLREEGGKSENETIRETSRKVLDTLEAAAKEPPVSRDGGW